ncbi:hypothetical protein K7W42_12980 [Deinococcus sp. HMF7604]|uniref:hypothetical protein n=1 Tax=Deinococcus betulae TaxID=2873312 RepID=UPI001CCFF1FE|nr:hypothetical protein [Deinococcus betulae]MBZ9751771.1 hypothetical protein [Deinococcus betulae]
MSGVDVLLLPHEETQRPPLPVVLLLGNEDYAGELLPSGEVRLEGGAALFGHFSAAQPHQLRSLQAFQQLMDEGDSHSEAELRLVISHELRGQHRATLAGAELAWTTGLDSVGWWMAGLPGTQTYRQEEILTVSAPLVTVWPHLQARRADLELATLGNVLLRPGNEALAALSPAVRAQVDQGLAVLGPWARVMALRMWLSQVR